MDESVYSFINNISIFPDEYERHFVDATIHDYRLKSVSAAIGSAETDFTLFTPTRLNRDLKGRPRDPLAPDVGALEYHSDTQSSEQSQHPK